MLRYLASVLLAAVVLTLVAAQYERAEPLHASALEKAPPRTRLVVLWVDSLAQQDVEASPKLPMLRQQLGTALHGPVRECTDAVSVPCFNAMTTGIDRFSLGSLWNDHGGASGLASGSVLRVLRDRGLRIGIAADAKITPAVSGLDWVRSETVIDDALTVQVSLEALEREALDLLMIQIRHLDQVSHRFHPGSQTYDDVLATTDAQIEALRRRLRPTDHLVVLGDHGHDERGRHFAGLDVPTYAAFWGPAFAHPMKRHMAMTDHATLWARVFGVRFGQVPWVEQYFAGAELPVTTELPAVASSAASMSPALAALLLLLSIAALLLPQKLPAPDAHKWRLLAALLVAFAALLGLGFVDYHAWLYARSYVRGTITSLAWGVPFALVAWLALRARRTARPSIPAWVLWAGAVFLLSPPTIHRFGGFVASTSAFLLALLVHAGFQVRRRRFQEALLALGFFAAFATIWAAKIVNFKLVFFAFYSRLLGQLQWLAIAAAVLTLWWLVRGRTARLRAVDLAFALGLGLAALAPWSKAALFIVPCVLAVPLTFVAYRKHALAPLAFGLSLPAYSFFFGPSEVRIAPLACALVLFPIWARLADDMPEVIRPLGLVVLCWALYFTAFGCRVSGLDFTYFYRWTDAHTQVEDTWLENALLTTLLYAFLPVLGLLAYRMARRTRAVSAGERRVIAHATLWAQAKLAAVLAFVVGYTSRGVALGPAATADLLMDAVFWLIASVVLLSVHALESAKLAPTPLPLSSNNPHATA